MNRTVYLLGVTAMISSWLCGGCRMRTEPAPGPDQPVSGKPAGTSSDQYTAPSRYAVVYLNQYVFDVPWETACGSEKIWSHVDELACGPEAIVTWKRSGLRFGVGTANDWPAIAALLKRADVRNTTSFRGLTPGSITRLYETSEPADRTIFYSGPDRRLHGRDCAGCMLALAAQVWRQTQQTNTVRIELRPLITDDTTGTTGSARLPQRTGRIDWPGESIQDLAVTVQLPADTFMLIGPDLDRPDSSLVGGHLLAHPDQEPRATLIVLAPQSQHSSGTRSSSGSMP